MHLGFGGIRLGFMIIVFFFWWLGPWFMTILEGDWTFPHTSYYFLALAVGVVMLIGAKSNCDHYLIMVSYTNFF